MNPLKQRDDMLAAEFLNSRTRPLEDELQQIETALFLEETFGFSISDDDISPESLGSAGSIRQFIQKKGGG